MITRIILLFIFFLPCNYLYTQAKDTPIRQSPDFKLLYELSGKNLNFSSIVSEDNIINLTDKLEKLSKENKDENTLFEIGQIKVNAYCLKGDIGLAINKAKQLYNDALKTNSNLGMALALQAIGNTYTHSNQSMNALVTLKEAADLLKKEDNDHIKIRLYLQIIEVCNELNDMSTMRIYLTMIKALPKYEEIVKSVYYKFYILGYEALYQIKMRDAIQAASTLKEMHNYIAEEELYKRWYYWIMCHYSELESDHKKALVYIDSTLDVVRRTGNLNEYRIVVIEKANLLETMDMDSLACEMYIKASNLTDTLNMERYSRQIEMLHTTYLADKLKMENSSLHSRMLTWIVSGCILLLLGGLLLYIIIRRKNNQLQLSRNKLLALREETTASIQSKSMFLSNMSHEIRTPLNGIVGFSDILTSNEDIDAETKQQCGDNIRQNADLLLKLIRDVMDFSNLKTNGLKFSFETRNVVNLCQTVIETVDKVKQTNAALHFIPALKSLELYTDYDRLQQVLINLLVNATKFTKSGDITLRLSIDENSHEAIFMVEDTGCGIPLEKQPHIFERFEKLHEGVQGAGLGLSICQQIVERFGGRIWIDSTYTLGARFIFTHPLPDKTN